MDAVPLIEATRQALARCRAMPETVGEAWQAQALVEAVGSLLAMSGPPAVRAEALDLREAGRRGCGGLHHELRATGTVRADGLTRVEEPRRTLAALAGLLGESGVALVGVAVSAAEEGLYWQCIEAIDAADESRDRITGLLRGLTLPERGGVA